MILLSLDIIINMSKFYTQTGDDGYTSLLGEGRVSKDSPRLAALGTLDESTASLGIARAVSQHPLTANIVLAVQRDLYHIMAEVAATPENAPKFRKINEEKVNWIEEQTDKISSQVNMPAEFIVPGDSLAGAAMSLARTVVRRAEREVTGLVHSGEVINAQLIRYLNRLSSLCFSLELLENQAAGKSSPTLAKKRSKIK
jgi:cob(I)alamin adenosyltransferase